MEKRSVVRCVLFSIITCGIYGLYWYYHMTNDAHQAVGRQTTASGGKAVLFALITCGIYVLYWTYKMGETIMEAQEARGMHTDKNMPVIYLVFALFGLGIVSEVLLQNTLNDIIDFDALRVLAENAAAAAPEALMPADEDNRPEPK